MNINEARIVYMGTPEISAVVLKDLIEAGFNIVALISNEDKEVGRKKILTPTPTKVVANSFNIPVYQPHRIRNDYEFLEEINPDLILTMAYGQIVPQAVLDIPKLGCLNLHGSLLPSLRGAAPIQRSIMNGDMVTGVTLMEMVDKMDAGKMFAKEEVKIEEDDNYTTLASKIALAASNVAKKYVPTYLEEGLKGEEQDESKVTFADKILPPEEHLNFEFNGEKLVNYIRGLSLTPGGYFLLDGHKYKIFKALFEQSNHSKKLGEIVKEGKKLLVAVKDGYLNIKEIQPEGKKPMDAMSFLNGNQNLIGKQFE